jgi:hypothetical protein
MPSIGALSLRIPVRCPTLIGLDFLLTTVVGIIGKRKQLLTYTHEKPQEQSLSDYAYQDLSKVTKRSPLDMQRI